MKQIFERISSQIIWQIFCKLFLLCICGLAVAITSVFWMSETGKLQKVHAASVEDGQTTVVLTAKYGSIAVSGADISLYKIASVDSNGKVHPDKQAQELAKEASTLAEYVQNQAMDALEQASTDQSGTATFRLDIEESSQLYLITGTSVKKDNVTYHIQPVIFSVDWAEISDPANTDNRIRIYPKVSVTKDKSDETTESSTEMNKGAISYQSNGNKSSENSNSGNSSSGNNSGGKLPQTGILWWPVILLLLLGVLIYLFGLWIDKKRILRFLGIALMTGVLVWIGTEYYKTAGYEKNQKEVVDELERIIEESDSESQNQKGDPSSAPSDQDDEAYIGMIEIPSVSIKIAVTEGWSYEQMKSAACCYAGSVSDNHMVIAAHNLPNFFGTLAQVDIGDQVIFTDMYGEQSYYEIEKTETVQANEVEKMLDPSWDLTLFTCNHGGRSRYAVRCHPVMFLDEFY